MGRTFKVRRYKKDHKRIVLKRDKEKRERKKRPRKGGSALDKAKEWLDGILKKGSRTAGPG